MMGASSSESPVLVMLDIPDDGGFYMKKVDKITSSEVTQFISDYKAKNLDRQQLS